MRRGTAMLVAGTCAGAVVVVLGVAAAVRPPDQAVPPSPAGPPLTTSVATTATAAPPDRAADRLRSAGSRTSCPGRPSPAEPARPGGCHRFSHRPGAGRPELAGSAVPSRG
ncbi:hypothetical protein AB0J55_45180 [Amycolatopsis sp. NPDC049688]|uniref:hypothetical protein n=1 Tax=Amycolatopsis sp. NPDC049688 TaxID=3154733 RepID=UPI003423B57A